MKVFIVRKKSLIAGALAICLAIVFLVALVNLIPSVAQAVAQASGQAAAKTTASARKIPIYCVNRSEKVVSLSFDAAWGNVIIRNT